MTAPALTHHEILGLVEPFTRRGRHVDLAASDRVARKLAFKPIDHVSAHDAGGTMLTREVLLLESYGTGTFKLTRTLSRADGLQATVTTLGQAPAEMLARIEAVAPERHFRCGPGYEITRSYEFDSGADGSRADRAAGPQLRLANGLVRLDGLTLTMRVPAVKGIAADIALDAVPGEVLDIPEDLLAVQGWYWARLMNDVTGWKTRLRLRGKPVQRSAQAEAALDQVARHLVQTLGEAPACFHERWLAARWGVVLRRLIPTLTAIGLIVGVLVLPSLPFGQASGLFLALHYVPIALLAASFMLQELPRFELPPLPRRSSAAGWRRPVQASSAPAAQQGISPTAHTAC
ncbi:MAG: hypothetical protein IPG93_01595 [Burkholderiales bacterium]|nr:hypothetical protein [Burkholderiales bacterium]